MTFDASSALDFAQGLGVTLGRSDEAMENAPTLAQAQAARDAMIAEYPGIDRMSESDFWPVFASAFERGYVLGKTDPDGARRRVEIKRLGAMERRVRPERTFESYSRGAELVETLRATWLVNNALPPGSNDAIEQNMRKVAADFDLTVPELHYWCKLAAKEAV